MLLKTNELPEEVKMKINKIAQDMSDGIIKDLVNMSINHRLELICVRMS